jgi:hypothetical protein
VSKNVSQQTARHVLGLPMQENDSGASTIGGYLTKLLHLVWEDREGFDGKRPFGNSGWDGDVYLALIKAGLVAGSVDEDGQLNTMDHPDEEFADRLVAAAIGEMGRLS